MKKRSLVAAIAMLLVSALVLTTATYAWFASNSSVNVSKIETSIGANDGSLQISADGSDWTKTTIAKSDLTGVGTNAFPAALTPVSYSATNKTFMAANFGTNSTISATGAATTAQYTQYTFYIRANVASYPVTITPTITGTNNFTYAAITYTTGDVSTTKLYGPASDSYHPVIAAGDAVDVNNNYIVDTESDTGDVATMLGATAETVTPTNDASFNITLSSTALSPTTVTVQIWAEGQDTDCTGLVASAFDIAIGIAKTAA